MSGLFVFLWFVGFVACGLWKQPIAADTVSMFCVLAGASCLLARRGAHRAGFEAGYQMAARHAGDVLREEMAWCDNSDRKRWLELMTQKVRRQVEIEGERDR